MWKRLDILRGALNRPFVKYLIAVWAMLSAWDLFVVQFLSPEVVKDMPRMYDFLKSTTGLLSWGEWIFVGVVILLGVVVEYAYRSSSANNRMNHENNNPALSEAEQANLQQVPTDNNLVVPDPALRVAIDEIYAVLQQIEGEIRHTLPHFGKRHILEAGKTQYIEMLKQYQSTVSNTFRQIAELSENKYGNHKEIYKFRFDGLKDFGKLLPDVNEFIVALNKLPEEINADMLSLIEDKIDHLKKSRGTALQWSRQCQTMFREMRN